MQFGKQFWTKTLGKDWAMRLKPMLQTKYSEKLMKFLQIECAMQDVTPRRSDIFKAFKLCPWDSVKVVILGHKPHTNPCVANGLAYGDAYDSPYHTPTLGKIYDCIEREYHEGSFYFDFNFGLEHWAEQGVLLLNRQLTVRMEDEGEHTKPWGKFVSEVLNVLVKEKPGTIYILWGDHKKLAPHLEKNNYVLTFDHPSNFVCSNKDWHCPNFKEANEILEGLYGETIKW
jgi:uracil-DNA glycosylase